MGQVRRVHGAVVGSCPLNMIVKMVLGAGQAELFLHILVRCSDQCGFQVKSTGEGRQARAALVQACPKPTRQGESFDRGGFFPSGGSKWILQMPMATVQNLKLHQIQRVLEVKAPFLETLGHVTIAENGQLNPGAERGAREGAP